MEHHVTATECHLLYGITQCYLLPDTSERTPRLHHSQSGRYSIYLPRRDRRLSWPRWLVTYRDGLPASQYTSLNNLRLCGKRPTQCLLVWSCWVMWIGLEWLLVVGYCKLIMVTYVAFTLRPVLLGTSQPFSYLLFTQINSSIHIEIIRDSCKSRQNGFKNTANFCEHRKNHGKDTASNHGPADCYKVYKTQHLALTTIITHAVQGFHL